MQVFISDLHLTDGTSGTTISEKAFKLLNDNLSKLMDDVNEGRSTATELKIVLLGDIFDVIRSTEWPADGNDPVQPWYPKSDAQEKVVQKIVDGIINNNRPSLNYIKGLTQLADTSDLQYVIGNHDWLINRYPNMVTTVAHSLGITPPPNGFNEDIFEPAYKTFARHGDKYDKYNYTNNNRNESSIGDAIVINLLNRFPEMVGQKLDILVAKGEVTLDERKDIVAKLKELDNIRPLLDAPSWILMVSNRASDAVRRVINDAWEKCADDFFKVQFIRDMGKLTVFELWSGLQLSSHIPKFILESLAGTIRLSQRKGEVRYDQKAWAEPRMRSGAAKYVLYGHTHDHLMVPMGQIPSNGGGTEDEIYFNTGTWRQTWNKAVSDTANRKFIGWKVLTYITFYKEGENNDKDKNDKNKNKDHNFEVWNGALG